MKRILIAYDGSAPADAAIDDLLHVGLSERGEALVMSVADVWLPPGFTETDPGAPVAVRKAQEQALQSVDAARSLAVTAAGRVHALLPGWYVTTEAIGDSPAWAILKRAQDWNADLVVVGAHSHSTLERLFLGSVSQKIVAEAGCSVRISRPRRRPHDAALRSIIGVDGSESSSAAVNEVAARRWPPSAQFRVATVIDPKMETAVAWPQVYASQWIEQRDEEAREWVCRMVEHHAKTLADAGLNGEIDIFSGDPKRLLLKFAEDWEADALILGARGLQHACRQYLGTTASAVVARAHCSVEIIRMK